MDNDFGRPMSPRERYSGMPPQPAQQPAPQPAAQSSSLPPQHYNRSGGIKRFLKFMLLLLLVAGAAYGAYYWQQSKIDDLNKKLASNSTQSEGLDSQLSTLKSQIAELTKTVDSALTNDLIPGQAVTNSTDGKVTVTGLFKSTTAPDEIWVEFGETTNKLDKYTAHVSKPTAADTTYSIASLEIPKTSVKAATTYFYRIVAKKGDKTTHSAIASFTTAK